MKTYTFDEITLSQITREEFAPVERLVEEALDSTTLAALGYMDRPEPVDEEDKVLEDDFWEKSGAAYKILRNGTLIGGAFLLFTPEDHKGDFVLFGLEPSYQGQGLGQRIWRYIEQIHAEIEVWELLTPAFAFRNVVFYVNKCGFHVVEVIKDKNNPVWDMYRFQKRYCASHDRLSREW